MKKTWLWLLLVLCLVPPTAVMAAEIPDPEAYFGGGGKWYDNTYRHVMERDPKAALTAYADVLQETYGMTLTGAKSEAEHFYWKLKAKDGTEIEVECVVDGPEYYTYVIASKAVTTVEAENWDWSKNVLMGQGTDDITVLPDFLKNDTSDKYYHTETGTDNEHEYVVFKADSTRTAASQAAEDYVELLLDKGYELIKKEDKSTRYNTCYKWFLECDELGISKFNLGQSAHVMVRVNIYPDWGYSNIDVRFAKGITMDGYGGTSDPDDDDLFEKDCWWCGYDGKCDECGGTGRVRKWVPGTREYETQTCEDCNMGKCRRCGGDGNKPN